MQIGMIGLNRMGGGKLSRLLAVGQLRVAHETSVQLVASRANDRATGADLLQRMVSQLLAPRVTCLMVPTAVVGRALGDLVPLPGSDDIVIDGGNSYIRDDVRRGNALWACSIRDLDVGTVAGVGAPAGLTFDGTALPDPVSRWLYDGREHHVVVAWHGASPAGSCP